MRKSICFLLTIAFFASLFVQVYAAEASNAESNGQGNGNRNAAVLLAETEEGSETPEVTECSHSYGVWNNTGEGHSRTCSLCGAEQTNSHSWDAGTVTTPPTCTAAGAKTFSCSACGAVKTESVDSAGHSFGSWEKIDASGHKRVCSVCGEEETASHGWDGGRITTEATCLTQGEKTFTCGSCGAVKFEPLPVSDHTYGEWTLDETTHSHTCTICGKVESGSHSWNGGSVTIPATCKEEGAFVYLCSGCGGALIEIIPKLTTHTYDNACDPDCNICGAERAAEHQFSAVWSKDAQGHWHVCTRCGERKDEGKHIPGPAATEEKAQLCLTCGYTLTAKRNHTHKFSNEWSWDETGHWYACEGCEEQKNFEAHSFEDQCDTDCDVCGYVRDAAHDYGDNWLFDETAHWNICTLCGQKSGHEDHVPGPEATAQKAQFCIVCGYELAPAQVHEHAFALQWEADADSHWKQCACGEKTEEQTHSWNDGIRNHDKTITYTCSVCGMERTEESSAGEFPWWIVVVAVLLASAVCAGVLLWYLLRKQSGKFAR